MKSVVFWVSFVLLLPQALYVRRTAPRFSKATGPTEHSVGEGSPVRLLAIGDSIIAGVGANTLDKALVGQVAKALSGLSQCRVIWKAVGISGYRTRQVHDRLLPTVSSGDFDYIVVSVGVNDITGLKTLSQWRLDLGAFVDALRDRFPAARIAVAGMPPMHVFPALPQPMRAVIGMRARMFDSVMRKVLSSRPNVEFVSLDFEADASKFSGDGYHPSEESYTEFGEQMAKALLDVGSEAGVLTADADQQSV